MTVAVLGMGAMGRRAAARLAASGATTVVSNRSSFDPPDGVRVAATPREAASDASVVMSFVADDDASRAVWEDDADGALGGLHRGALAIECSTVTPARVRALAAAVVARGAAFAEAPVVGSLPQVEQGRLHALVGAEPGVFARVSEALAPLTVAVHAVGPVGSGAAVKLAINALFTAQVAATAEALAYLYAQGVDVGAAAAAFGATPVASPAAVAAMAAMRDDRHTPLFPLRLAAKDLRYFLDGAADAAVITAVSACFEGALARGLGDLHLTAVARRP